MRAPVCLEKEDVEELAVVVVQLDLEVQAVAEAEAVMVALRVMTLRDTLSCMPVTLAIRDLRVIPEPQERGAWTAPQDLLDPMRQLRRTAK